MPLHPLIHCPNGPRLRSATTDCWQCAICGDYHAGAPPAKPVEQEKTYAHGSPFDPTQRLPLPFAPLASVQIEIPNDLPRAFPIAQPLPAKPLFTPHCVTKAGPVDLQPGPPPPGLPPGFLAMWTKRPPENPS
jgi:hypothetical protein